MGIIVIRKLTPVKIFYEVIRFFQFFLLHFLVFISDERRYLIGRSVEQPSIAPPDLPMKWYVIISYLLDNALKDSSNGRVTIG